MAEAGEQKLHAWNIFAVGETWFMEKLFETFSNI